MVKRFDEFALQLADRILRHPWWVMLITMVAVCFAANGVRHLEFSNNYRVFFGKNNPELLAFEEFQATYTKNDNILFVIQPADKKVFQPHVVDAIEKTTQAAWQIPYTIRVDSITNFQHSWAEGDDLTVEDLIQNGISLSEDALLEKKKIALSEPLLVNKLISEDAGTTGINVTLQFPEKSLTEVPEAVAAARKIAADMSAQFPDLKIVLSGLTMLDNAFPEAGISDLKFLVPIMYLLLVMAMVFSVRSISGTFVTVLVVGFSSVTAMGITGYIGMKLSPVSSLAPTIILTLAIADSIHLLLSLKKHMRQGLVKKEAIRESLRINALPVTITSLTTVVGFLGLNFSDSPPFHDLGNITAMGITAAWGYSMTFLPAMIMVLPFRVKADEGRKDASRIDLMQRYTEFIITHHKSVGLLTGVVALIMVLMVCRIELNDEFIKFFDHRVPFRNDTEFTLDHLTGLYVIEYSLGSGEKGGINNVAYLRNLEAFTGWLRQAPEVTHVYSYTDIIKRLNKNMHGDDPSWYRIPDDRNLAAQYLLLYELSLPFGLDLNDRINIDKSATRVSVTLPSVTTTRAKEFIDRSQHWLTMNTPSHMQAVATGAAVMFIHISKRNIVSMIKGNILALFLIMALIIISLKSIKIGALSLLPNALPILVTFGVWALIVGKVGMAAATLTSTSLGIIVDDSVHFLTKFLRGRRELKLSRSQALRFTFDTVGPAIIATSVILVIGFAVLATSTFQVNAHMGLLTVIAIVMAFVFDFTLLPALLLIGHKEKETAYEPNISQEKLLKTL